MRCPNCGCLQPATHSGPHCFNCAAEWVACTCPKPVVVNDKKFMPCRNATCPVHGDEPPVPEELNPIPQGTPAEMLAEHTAKLTGAGLPFESELFAKGVRR